MTAAAKMIMQQDPVWNVHDESINFYYWYYAAYALHSINHGRSWREKLQRELVRHQRSGGNSEGSWDPIGVWGKTGGRVHSTVLGILILETDYRFSDRDAFPEVAERLPFTSLRKEFLAHRYDRVFKALKSLESRNLPEEDQRVLSRAKMILEQAIAFAMKEVNGSGRGPDFLAEKNRLKEIERDYSGLEPARQAQKVLERFAEDSEIKLEIKASTSLESYLKRYSPDKRVMLLEERLKFYNPTTVGLHKSFGKALKALVQKHPGTYATKLAQEKLKVLNRGY